MLNPTVPRRLALFLSALSLLPLCASAQPSPHQLSLDHLTANLDARLGIAILTPDGIAGVKLDQRFSLQSVMKLIVAAAALDAADRGHWRLDDPVTVRREDLSLYVQPIARLVRQSPDGYKTTIADLLRRAVVDSDSAATDILIDRLGGPKEVQAFLRRKRIDDIRIDRDERHLQTEIVGLEWRREFINPDVLNRAIEAVPHQHRDQAYRRYQTDPRDTATPAAMASFLHALADGKLLSPASTDHLIQVMLATTTFPDRLKAGLSPGWKLAHKTGTSGAWQGVTAATNDVGLLISPTGRRIPIVVFIADSRASSNAHAELMAKISRAVIDHHR